MRNRRWSTSSVVLARTARLEKNEIRLNPVLLLENQREFIDEVVPHELAHLLVWQHISAASPHGKRVEMDVPRVAPTALNSLRSARTPSLSLSLSAAQLTVRRHNRVVRGEATYRCVRCGDLLVAENNHRINRNFLI